MDAISIKKLEKKYSNTHALRGIDLTVKEGDFFALLGQNGAGKTTTISILTGLCNKTSGTATLFGKDIEKDYKEARSLVGLVPQEFNFDTFEKVYNVLYFSAGYYGVPQSERPARIKKVLTDLGLWEKRDSKMRELSGGMKRKAMIARALMHQPKLIILDEPTAGVDVETRKAMWKYFKQLNKEGVTILLTTHYIEEAEQLCNRVAIIKKGEVIKVDDTKNMLNILQRETLVIDLKKQLKSVPKKLSKYTVQLEGKRMHISINSKKDDWNKVIDDLHNAGIDIDSLHTKQNSLEEVFIHLTHDE